MKDKLSDCGVSVDDNSKQNEKEPLVLEWFVKELQQLKFLPTDSLILKYLVELAKEMQKNQMIDFADNYMDNCVIPNEDMAIPTLMSVSDYYLETFHPEEL